MITALLAAYHSFGIIIFFLGLQGILFLPLTIVYEIWKRRFLGKTPPFKGMVTVLIPAYNEEKTIRATITSVLASSYPEMEVIVVNDGSTDDTEGAISEFIESGKIRYIKKKNDGKASALNSGIAAAKGEVIVFTDADSIFLPDTVHKMVRWFADPSVDAVCGNDAPLHPSTPIQKFLTVTTHIGTGFVRRALSIMRCLPIITGNLGAIRTGVVREINGFKEIWGEDLEITFRLYKYRKRIIFDPDPKVIAECPGTITGLWKQRIRWIRSYIKIVFLHKDLFFNSRYRPFSFYLPVNFLNMAVVPVLQVLLLFLIPWAYWSHNLYFANTMEVLTYLGVIFFFVIAVYSIAIDRDWKDFVYLPYGLLILPLSYFYNMVAIYSWYKEFQKAEERWDKIERRKVITTARTRWEYAAIAALLIAGASGITFYTVSYIKTPMIYQPSFQLGISTHFDAWDDWRKAVANVLSRRDIGMARVVGVSAGRPEWAYFRWNGHHENWSNHQKGANEDLLGKATSTFHRSGFKVAALIDIFAPRYISQHPGTAAVAFDGKVHDEQVAFMELVEGRYGRIVLDMIEYIAANYPVDIINLTETPYYTFSYNDADLRSFKKFSGMKDWPRLGNGTVNRDDPAIWEWRSTLMEKFLAQAAERAHRHKKELYVDVPVSWKDLSQNGRESGLDYKRVLKHADNIVVWNYFNLEGLPPNYSEKLSRYLTENLPKDSFYVSIGLWGEKEPLKPAPFSQAVLSTLRGGATRIWVTPDSMITGEHWEEVRNYLKNGAY